MKLQESLKLTLGCGLSFLNRVVVLIEELEETANIDKKEALSSEEGFGFLMERRFDHFIFGIDDLSVPNIIFSMLNRKYHFILVDILTSFPSFLTEDLLLTPSITVESCLINCAPRSFIDAFCKTSSESLARKKEVFRFVFINFVRYLVHIFGSLNDPQQDHVVSESLRLTSRPAVRKLLLSIFLDHIDNIFCKIRNILPFYFPHGLDLFANKWSIFCRDYQLRISAEGGKFIDFILADQALLSNACDQIPIFTVMGQIRQLYRPNTTNWNHVYDSVGYRYGTYQTDHIIHYIFVHYHRYLSTT